MGTTVAARSNVPASWIGVDGAVKAPNATVRLNLAPLDSAECGAAAVELVKPAGRSNYTLTGPVSASLFASHAQNGM